MGETTQGKPLTRRELRAARESQTAASGSVVSSIGQMVARAALLGLLVTFTIIAPISGLLTVNMSIAAPSDEQGASLLQVLSGREMVEDLAGLEAVPAAVSRTRLRTAAQMGLCSPAGNSANGDIASAELAQKLVWPMYKGTGKFVSPFGMRTNPVTGVYMLHEGVDWAAPVGTPLLAVADGVVIKSGPFNGGNAIYIQHDMDGDRFVSGYLHMYSNQLFVKEGEKVKAGQLIGGVGSSGRSTGPHLHFEIRLGSAKRAINPLPFMESRGAVYPNPDCR